MIKVSCEVPYDLLDRSEAFNDYDYCLAHEYLRNESYKNFYLNQKKKGRVIFLDNSCFELGCSVDIKVYAEIINELCPNLVFLPDCYTDNSDQVLERIYEFKESLKTVELVCKPCWCAVIHGSSLKDALNTWKRITTEFSDFVGRIAVSKSLLLKQEEINYYKDLYHLEDNPFVDFNRYLFFYVLLYHGNDFGVEYKNEELHCLGNFGAFEFKNKLYKKLNILSVDTSHPVTVAMDPYAKGKSYSEYNTREYSLQYRDGRCITPVLANCMYEKIDKRTFERIKANFVDYKRIVNHL